MNFLRNLLASILGCMIALGIMFFMFFIFLSLIASMGNADTVVVVPDHAVLELQFPEPIKDYGGEFKFTDFNYEFEEYNGLNSILHAISVAKTDDKIKGISLNNSFLMAGISQARAIRNALIDFKSSGKFVYAFSDFYMQKDYYLASVADSVFLNPSGEVDFRGLSSEVLFYNIISIIFSY